MPQISILISTYKEEERFIRESIESLLNQSFQDFEIILVNDNPSRDEIKAIIDSYHDNRIRYIHNEKNVGLALSMNIAAASSHSDVLARMDADDVAELNRLQKEFDIIRQKDVDLVFSAFTKINEDSKVITEPPTQEQDSYGKSLSHAISLNPSIVHHPTVMMRKKIFDEVGGYRNFPCSQDADLWLRLQEVNCKFYRIGCPLLKYRVNTRSISQKNWFRQRLTWYYIFNLSVERLKTGGRDSYSLNDYNDKMQEQGVDDAKSEAKLRKSYFYLQKGQSSNRIYRLLYRVLAFLSHPILRQYVYNVKYKKKNSHLK